MRRTLLLPVAAATLAVLAPQASAEPKAPELTWSKCPPSLIGIEDPRLVCATLPVPLDYRNPKGRTIDVQVSKLTTAKPEKRRGVLLHNAGGPGGPSLHLPAIYTRIYPQEILDRYDLIGFDPRGVGYSTPVTCGRPMEGYPPDLYFPFPSTDGSIARNIEFGKALSRDCELHGGDIRPHITTANTARDMDRIRSALGEKKISYNSGSYGSYLGAVYATMFADKSDRFVIDSNVDPNRVWHDQWALWDHGFELRFADIASWFAERDDTYKFGATPAEVRKKYESLLAKLDTNPINDPVFGRFDGNVLRVATFGSSYHTLFFPDIAKYWIFADTGVYPPGLAAKVPTVPGDNVRASQLAVVCGDAGAPRDMRHYQREVAINRELFPLMAGMGTNVWSCAFGRGPVEPPVKVTSKGPANVLIIQTLRDPATPYVGALGMRHALGQRAKMVSVDSGNHGAYDPSSPSCATREAHRFLETGVLPARDMFCKPDPVSAASEQLSPLLLTR
ncbi:alpha/beta hydrolase [Kibdelosporangium philippinense]|uniref:Alpha/beta hydrolase n=1 Tax=Kibdelosporangium philippinense TaxID=211113 RepID=A0ABS8ZUV3_9PSEU|nr:alpha/beta hydrolase [Kibdelosporangium philippinense]MCE7011476.1 alpha/beta hydrolase [Kibdelosporangium philippinense]